MPYKICVYAIAKNEEQFLRRWYASMSEADYIAVLDTGSTDTTVSILNELGVITETEIISPWRFDHARNASMRLIPDDTDICVCVDIDEVFHPGWRKLLEDAWQDGVTRARYRYTWNFNDDGSEGVVFWSDKIHSYGDHIWTHPVHEILQYTGTDSERFITVPGIQLDHHADNSKSRSQYLSLLELSVEEAPDDDRNMHYLGREYMFYGMWDKCIETLMRHLDMPSAVWADERSASMRFIGKAYAAKGDVLSAKKWYLRAIAEAPYLREPYMYLASLLQSIGDWEGVIYFTRCALDITTRPESYICEAESWGALPYDLASLGYYYTGQFEKSLDMAKKALELMPDDERLQQNVEIIQAAIT